MIFIVYSCYTLIGKDQSQRLDFLKPFLLLLVGSVEWLRRRTCDQHSLSSKPTRAILMCAWERHFTALSPAWWSWQAVLNFNHISIKLQAAAISWHLRKQVGVIAYPMY